MCLGGSVCVCLKWRMFLSFSILSIRCWVRSESDTNGKQAYQHLRAGVELCGENTWLVYKNKKTTARSRTDSKLHIQLEQVQNDILMTPEKLKTHKVRLTSFSLVRLIKSLWSVALHNLASYFILLVLITVRITIIVQSVNTLKQDFIDIPQIFLF